MAEEINNSISFDRELSDKLKQDVRYGEEVRARRAQLRHIPASRPVNSPAPAATAAAPSNISHHARPASAPAMLRAVPDATDAEARAQALAAVMARYFKVKDQFYLKDPQNTPAFKDKGEKLSTKLDDPTIARSMVDLARAKGWDCIKIAGSQEFKREVWLYASAQGLQVSGFKPTELDLLKQAQLNGDVAKVVQSADHPAASSAESAPPEVTALQALQQHNTDLMAVPKNGLGVDLARKAVKQDVDLFRAITDPKHRLEAVLVIGDNVRNQAAYASELTQNAPEVATEVGEVQKRQAARDRAGFTGLPNAKGDAPVPAQQELGIAPAPDLPPPLSPRHIAALEAMEISLRRTHHTDTQIKAAVERTRKEWANDRVYVGRVVEHGAANYDFKPDGSPSHYVRLEDPQGAKFLLWGVDLPRALQASSAKEGEDLVVAFQGAKKVDVPVVVDGDRGRSVRYESVDRNVWNITPVRMLAPQAAEAMNEKSRRSQGPQPEVVKRALQAPLRRMQTPVRAAQASRGR